jgi:putative transposase
MDGLAPRLFIRDRDEKFGRSFDRVAQGVGTRVIKTAMRAPNMNPVAERFVGSLRREAPARVLLLGEQNLEDVGGQYVSYFNRVRPHQGVGQRIPDAQANENHDSKITVIPVLAGLHHDYGRAA